MTAFASGTVTGHIALLEALRTFATTHTDLVAAGEEWADNRWALTGSEREWCAQGPGLAAADEIFVGIRTETDAGNDRYNWQLQGATAYEPSSAWEIQPGANPTGTTNGVRIYLWNGAIPYWFVASGRRLIMVAKVSTTYQSLYLGLALPYALPGQYPYPLVVGGSGCLQARRWSDTVTGHAAFWCPRNETSSAHSALRMRMPDGSWPAAYQGNVFRLLPARDSTDISFYLRECPDGTRPLRPVVLATSGPANNALGEMDGIFQVPGFGAAVEDLVTYDGDDYLMVQNIHRTTTTDYCAVRLD